MFTGRGYAVRIKVLDGCEIDRLLYLGHLTNVEHSVAENFHRLIHAAGLISVRATSYDSAGKSSRDPQPITNKQSRARARVNAIASKIIPTHGANVWATLLHAVQDDAKICDGVRLAALRHGIRALAACQDEPPKQRRAILKLLDEAVPLHGQ